MKGRAESAERLADHFVNYLFESYQGSRHVRRVSAWVGFLVKAVERSSRGVFSLNRQRQLLFEYRGRRFKARYNHTAGPRGGIEVVQVLPGHGAPDGEVMVRVAKLGDAEKLYHDLEMRLDQFAARG